MSVTLQPCGPKETKTRQRAFGFLPTHRTRTLRSGRRGTVHPLSPAPAGEGRGEHSAPLREALGQESISGKAGAPQARFVSLLYSPEYLKLVVLNTESQYFINT